MTATRRRANSATARDRILDSAEKLVADRGYNLTTIVDIAADAHVATGSVYLHFTSKAALFDEVFRRAAGRELDAVRAAAAKSDDPREQLDALIETFTMRALKNRTLAWALLAEPVDPIVDAERLKFRLEYRDTIAKLLEHGIAQGFFRLEPEELPFIAAGIVGMIAEALVGPTSPLGRPKTTAAARLGQEISTSLCAAVRRIACR
jgi:AcrR family transcriptional regulator